MDSSSPAVERKLNDDRAASRTEEKRLETLGSLPLRVLLGTHHFDSNEAFVPFDPRVVSRRDSVRFTRVDSLLGPILHAHGNTPGNGIPNVGNLT
jgi:hypothetical protein